MAVWVPSVDTDKVAMGLGILTLHAEDTDPVELACREATFTLELERHDMDIPGALGPIEGLSWYTQIVPQLSVTLLDWVPEVPEGRELHSFGEVTLEGKTPDGSTNRRIEIKRGKMSSLEASFPGQSDEHTQTLEIVGAYDPDELDTIPVKITDGSDSSDN